MSTQAPAETDVVSGQVVGVITKPGDKWQVEVNTGGQYTRRLWTKDVGLANQMQTCVGQSFDFICGVSHWTGQSGPVRSLWINSVALFGSTPVTQQQTPGTGTVQPVAAPVNTQGTPIPQGMPTLSPMEKEERIMREHAMGVVALMLPHIRPEERNAEGMVRVAEGLIAYYKLGPPGLDGRSRQHRDPEAPPEEETPPMPGESPGVDDGIPFDQGNEEEWPS